MQVPIGSAGSPLLPPNKFRYTDGRTNILITNDIDARLLYDRYSRHHSNKNKKRKYVDGALYQSLFSNCVEVIEPIPGGHIQMNVRIGCSSEISQVQIVCDTNLNSKYLLACN